MSDSSSNHQTSHCTAMQGACGDSGNEARGAGAGYPKGTMMILSPERTKAETPKRAAASVNSSSRGLGACAAMVASAAVIGGLTGSLATAGISHLRTPEPEMPSYYSAFAESLGRVDRELMALKSATESSAKATDQQVALIAERMDRSERAQPETGPKPAKAPESIERTERAAAVSGDVAVTAAESRTSVAGGHSAAAETRPASPTPIVDGWVVRDVYRGAALIQGRAGMIEVLPGDNLPGLGRIQQVRRQDGRWIVVTSKGQIVSR